MLIAFPIGSDNSSSLPYHYMMHVHNFWSWTNLVVVVGVLALVVRFVFALNAIAAVLLTLTRFLFAFFEILPALSLHMPMGVLVAKSVLPWLESVSVASVVVVASIASMIVAVSTWWLIMGNLDSVDVGGDVCDISAGSWHGCCETTGMCKCFGMTTV